MNDLRTAAQQALDALEDSSVDRGSLAAITALRAALAEPQTTHSADCYKWHHECAIAEVQRLRITLAEPCPCGDRTADKCPGEWEPGCDLGNNPKHAKRAGAVQEPVAWMGVHDKTDLYYRKPPQADVIPLYTAPPRCPNCASLEAQNTELDRRLADRKPLTKEEIQYVFRTIARAIEAAHGIMDSKIQGDKDA